MGGIIRASFSQRPVLIKTSSLLARFAAWKMGSPGVALVLGRTIHLHSTSEAAFIANKAWVNHELAHVQQYLSMGTGRFLYRYLREWIFKGYYHISLEKEARMAEANPSFSWEYEAGQQSS